MTAQTLSISRLISVSVNLSPSGATSQNLSTLLILGSSDVIDVNERYRVYTGIAGVAADFGTTAPEYLAAVLWFEQLPQPTSLLIGRWAQTATKGVLKGATLSAAQQLIANFNTISNGEFTYTLNGGAPTTTAAINLTSATTLSGVAALITAALSGLTVTWNSSFQRFEAESSLTGATSVVSFFSTPGGGTDISGILGMQSGSSGCYQAPGIAAETALACVTLFDGNYGQAFYGVTMIGTADSDTLLIAPYIEAASNKHVFFVTTQEAGVLSSVSTTDIAYLLSQLLYKRTWVQYSSSNAYAAISAAARILTTNFQGNNTVITLMWKQEPGIVAESMNVTQITVLESKNCNVFVEYNNATAIIEPSKTSSGIFLDVITGTDWLALAIQTALYNLLYTSTTKIPQTDAGSNQMVNVIEAICAQAVTNGLLAPGTWTTGGFGILNMGDFMPKGYYVYAPPVSSQSSTNRTQRIAVPIQVAAKLAGAVHTIAMSINVNQ